ARVAHLALLQEKFVGVHLHPGGAAGQHDEADAQARDDELAAPHRRLAREQRAGGVDHAAAGHCVAPASLIFTYCVIAGPAVRICSCSLASFSTRSGVACARFSNSRRSFSTGSLRASLLALSSSASRRPGWYCVRTRNSALAIAAASSTRFRRIMRRSSRPPA